MKKYDFSITYEDKNLVKTVNGVEVSLEDFEEIYGQLNEISAIDLELSGNKTRDNRKLSAYEWVITLILVRAGSEALKTTPGYYQKLWFSEIDVKELIEKIDQFSYLYLEDEFE